jgi:hypothetical protein
MRKTIKTKNEGKGNDISFIFISKNVTIMTETFEKMTF